MLLLNVGLNKVTPLKFDLQIQLFPFKMYMFHTSLNYLDYVSALKVEDQHLWMELLVVAVAVATAEG